MADCFTNSEWISGGDGDWWSFWTSVVAAYRRTRTALSVCANRAL